MTGRWLDVPSKCKHAWPFPCERRSLRQVSPKKVPNAVAVHAQALPALHAPRKLAKCSAGCVRRR